MSALFPQIAESYGVLTKIDGWVLGGMQFGVLVRVLLWGAGVDAGAFLRE